MEQTERERLEGEVRAHCERGAPADATRAAIECLGPEIRTFLLGLMRAEHDADEVFSLWCERVFLGLPGFEWGSSLRTWSYAIARNLASNHRRGQRRRRIASADSAQLERLAQEVRSATRPYLQTGPKDTLARIREMLAPDDRALLVLRVDREMEWKDIADVMHDVPTALDEAARTREAQRLRKRFQLLKEKLVTLARQHGMFDE